MSGDESLCQRLPVLQTVLKLLQFGIKTLKLCESSSDYLWSFIAYLGISSHFERHTQTTGVVPKLSEPLFHKGYKSPTCNANCMGTLKINRKSVPKKVKEKSY
jgi:hypothetical protein